MPWQLQMRDVGGIVDPIRPIPLPLSSIQVHGEGVSSHRFFHGLSLEGQSFTTKEAATKGQQDAGQY